MLILDNLKFSEFSLCDGSEVRAVTVHEDGSCTISLVIPLLIQHTLGGGFFFKSPLILTQSSKKIEFQLALGARNFQILLVLEKY